MRIYPAAGAIILSCLALNISLFSGSPKCVVRGRVVDAETQQPIKGAVAAIRWYAVNSEQHSAKAGTLDAVQALSDDEGVFQIPQYPDKQYTLGVYKNGYICWSSRDIFSIDPGLSRTDKYPKKNHRIKEGMEIELEPLQNGHPRDLHAGFTMMVAGESTDTDLGPFHQAIQAEYQLWRKNLRKDFQKQVGAK